MDTTTTYLINPIEAQSILLSWIGSDDFKEKFESTSTAQSKEFKMGAMWGVAMAGLIIATQPEHHFYYPREVLISRVKSLLEDDTDCKLLIDRVIKTINGESLTTIKTCNGCEYYDACPQRIEK